MTEPGESDRALIERALDILAADYERQTEFNEHFDSEDSIQIGELSYPRSKVLYWVDRDAYANERAAWENELYDTKHESARALIANNAYENRFADLIQAIGRGRLVPFVGAGLSASCGMPLWGDALRLLLGRLVPPNEEEIRETIAAGEYLRAAQALAAHDAAQTANFISTMYRLRELRLAGPVTLLPKLASGCVVTTNFDDAIEKTYELAEQRFEHYMHGAQDHNFFGRMLRGDRCILKLHGDAENRATHVLTREQYEAAYGQPFDFSKPLPKALRQIFVSQSLLFLGCSLEQDWTMDLFAAAVHGGGFEVPVHYAVLAMPADDAARRQKEARLIRLNIQPLWYPAGEHGAVQQLLELAVDVTQRRVSFAV
ncbi:SIR2 family NAD-dependent protein deacylase [Methylibium sp.]|uniref:SIR2 family NAD-dependent protein deacylase n=1 Tax=Methylibium sp. TaxID=2067992 RepID=UPI003D09E614